MGLNLGRWDIARLYHLGKRWHAAVPYHLGAWGYALPPLHYFCEVTRRCNLRCAMCQYIRWFDRHPPEDLLARELTTDEWKRVIDQTGRFGLVTFTGGEPFVRPDFLKILAYASAKHSTHVITNGTRLTEDAVLECVKLGAKSLGGRGLNVVGISLHGPQAVHNRLVGQDDAYERAMAGIAGLVRGRLERHKPCPLVHVTAVICRDSVESLPLLPELVAKGGGDILNLAAEIRLHDLEGIGERNPADLPVSELAVPKIEPQLLERALDETTAAASAAGIPLRLPRMPREQLLRYYSAGTNLSQFDCRSVWSALNIGADGSVCPCFIYKAGDVREQSLRRIWNGPRMRAFRLRLKRQGPFPICDGCCELEYTGGKVARG